VRVRATREGSGSLHPSADTVVDDPALGGGGGGGLNHRPSAAVML